MTDTREAELYHRCLTREPVRMSPEELQDLIEMKRLAFSIAGNAADYRLQCTEPADRQAVLFDRPILARKQSSSQTSACAGCRVPGKLQSVRM